MQNSCILKGFSPWHLEDGSYPWQWGDLSPAHGRATRLGRVQQHTTKALPPSVIYFSHISTFKCKAGKSNKALSYLQALEKWLLDLKMGLIYLFYFYTFQLMLTRNQTHLFRCKLWRWRVGPRAAGLSQGICHWGATWLFTSCIAFCTVISLGSPSPLS